MTSSQSPRGRLKGRTPGRLAAVQALFQIEQTRAPSSSVVSEFLALRLKDKDSGLSQSAMSFFAKLVEGTWKTHMQCDEMINGTLKVGWSLERIQPVTRAILRAALYELLETQTPSAVIINEYLDITHDFFDETEVAFVNGVLNTLAKKIRPSLKTNT